MREGIAHVVVDTPQVTRLALEVQFFLQPAFGLVDMGQERLLEKLHQEFCAGKVCPHPLRNIGVLQFDDDIPAVCLEAGAMHLPYACSAQR